MGAANITEVETKRAAKWRSKGLTWSEIGDKLERTPGSLSKAVQALFGRDPIEEPVVAPKKTNGHQNGAPKKRKGNGGRGWSIQMTLKGKKMPPYRVSLEKGMQVMQLLEED